MEEVIDLLRAHKIIFLSCVGYFLFFPLFLVVIKSLSGNHGTNPYTVQQTPTSATTATNSPLQQGTSPSHLLSPTISLQKPFHVISTNPLSSQTGIPPGEIQISFTTDTYILSPLSFSVSFSPPLPYSYTLKTDFPSKTVIIQILGGLAQNTQYTISIYNQKHSFVYSWSFTTSGQQQENSSQGVKQKENSVLNSSYPLYNVVPFSNNDFNIDYTGPNTLKVQITNSNVSMVKQEVINWIKSNGVDPNSQTLNYVNAF